MTTDNLRTGGRAYFDNQKVEPRFTPISTNGPASPRRLTPIAIGPRSLPRGGTHQRQSLSLSSGFRRGFPRPNGGAQSIRRSRPVDVWLDEMSAI
jgi:hypothetical protein